MKDIVKALGIISAIAGFAAIVESERSKRRAAIERELQRRRLAELKSELKKVRNLLEGLT